VPTKLASLESTENSCKSDNAGWAGPYFVPFFTSLTSYLTEYKEAFALFDKKGTGAVPRETLGDLLRALGQNPTQSEVADIVASAPRDGK
jgi:Ca2+-binding EF-hand superfamily protein